MKASSSTTSASTASPVLKQFATQPQPQPQPQPVAPAAVAPAPAQDVNNKMVPIHLTLPPPPGSADTQPRTFNIQVPASAIQSKNRCVTIAR